EPQRLADAVVRERLRAAARRGDRAHLAEEVVAGVAEDVRGRGFAAVRVVAVAAVRQLVGVVDRVLGDAVADLRAAGETDGGRAAVLGAHVAVFVVVVLPDGARRLGLREAGEAVVGVAGGSGGAAGRAAGDGAARVDVGDALA